MRATPSPGIKGAIALVLSMVAAGCNGPNFDGLGKAAGCAAVGTGRGLGDAIALSVAAPQLQPLEDDSGVVVPAVEGRCTTDACKPRLAQVGTQIELQVDATALAASRGITLGTEQPALISTNPDVIKVANGKPMVDPCSDHLIVGTGVKFAQAGQAALRVQHGDVELASFSFEVARASSLQVTAQPGTAPSSLQIEDAELGTRSVRGGLHAGVFLRVQAHAKDGREMLLDNSVVSTIEDPSVAQFLLSDEPNSARGVKLYISFLKEGSTTLRTESGELTSLVELHADPSLPSPQPSAAGSASPRP